MERASLNISIFLLILLAGCNELSNRKVKFIAEPGFLNRPSISSVRVSNDQLIVTGSNLDSIDEAKIQGPSTHTFSIESKSETRLVLNASSALTLLTGQALNLFISNAHASATFPIQFELEDGQVTASKLHNMGAASGQVLKFDGTSWGPGANLWSENGTAAYYNDGNVGIGTDDPQAKLHVVGGGYFTDGLYSEATLTSTSGVSQNLSGWFEANPASDSSAGFMNYIGGGTPGTNSNNITGAIYAQFAEAYHAGTGTANHVAGVRSVARKDGTGDVTNLSAFRAVLKNDEAVGTVSNMYGLYVESMIRTGAVSNSWGIYVHDTTADNYFGGSVGIGIDSPTEKLDVVGNIKTSGCLYYASSSLGTCASDKRLKKDIHSFDLGLDALLGINPVHFKYNGLGGIKQDGKEQIGVIAQDVQKTAPELVKTQMIKLRETDKGKTEVKVVDYGAFTYVIINAVKELHEKVVDIYGQISGINSEIKQNSRVLASVKEENRLIKDTNKELDEEIAELKAENKLMRNYLCQRDPSAPFCKKSP